QRASWTSIPRTTRGSRVIAGDPIPRAPPGDRAPSLPSLGLQALHPRGQRRLEASDQAGRRELDHYALAKEGRIGERRRGAEEFRLAAARRSNGQQELARALRERIPLPPPRLDTPGAVPAFLDEHVHRALRRAREAVRDRRRGETEHDVLEWAVAPVVEGPDRPVPRRRHQPRLSPLPDPAPA